MEVRKINNKSIIQKSIDFIEENLKTEITAKEIADLAGFSLFHYYRIFQAEVGMPVMQYVLKRRLLNVIYEVSKGQKMIDVALLYGFDTHAGFFKAFKREFFLSPSQYIKKYTVTKPYAINLSQERYIMITHKKVTEILTKWGMENEKITDIYYENTGNKNERAFCVGDMYLIKIVEDEEALKNHIELSKSLEQAGLTTASPVKNNLGEDYYFDGNLYYMVSKRIEGSPVKTIDMYEGDYMGKARYHGEIIGQLHLILQNDETICNESNLFDTVTNWAMPVSKEIMGLDTDFCDDYIKTFGKLYNKLPKQIIHRDPNPSNIILNDGKLSGFIDFELSERNVRIFDPCYASTAILSESFAKNDQDKLLKWFSIYKSIILGYDSVSKLTKEEKQALPYVVFSIQMICAAWCTQSDKYSELGKTNVAMLNFIIKNIKQLNVFD